MKTQNKNNATDMIDSVIGNIGFLAMTAASLLVMAPELTEVRAHANTPAGGHAADAHHSSQHEKMEEIRHHPHSYGSVMRSPATAGTQ